MASVENACSAISLVRSFLGVSGLTAQAVVDAIVKANIVSSDYDSVIEYVRAFVEAIRDVIDNAVYEASRGGTYNFTAIRDNHVSYAKFVVGAYGSFISNEAIIDFALSLPAYRGGVSHKAIVNRALRFALESGA